MHENEIARIVLESALDVHRTLGGPGLLEGVYEEALAWELGQRGLAVERQVQVPIRYKGHELALPLRIDLLVAGKVIVECKAVETLNAIAQVQVLTYCRLTGMKLGLVVNFGMPLLRQGFHRVVNGLPEDTQVAS
jgi:GxxExxY protein